MSFLNPFFLIALGAAAIPVVLHLVRKVQARRVPFSSLRFLTVTPQERVRRRRLKDILLMALRMLILALLVLAFARPFIPQEAISFIPQREDRSVVLLVDRSYSMQAGEAFQQALAEVRRQLDAAQGDDEFAIVAFDDEAQQLTDLTDDPGLLRGVLDGPLATAGNRPTDFFPPLQLAEEILQSARNEQREIVLISDLQRGGWTGSFDNWKLARDIAFTPIPVGGDVAGNAFVEAFHLDRQRAGSRTVVRFDARVQARGEAVREQDVQLTVDGANIGAQPLAPVEAGRVTFQQEASRTGIFQGVLELEPDPLEIDNRYYLTYRVEGRPSLLVVDGLPRGTRRDAFFLQSAFALGETALYEFTADTPRRLAPSGLREHSVVFVANVPSFSGSQLDALRTYVEDGGSVVLSFGEETDVAAFDRHLQDLGIGQAGPVVNARTEQGHNAIIGEVDTRHPVFSVFGGTGAGAIFRPQFRRYVRVAPDSSAVVLGRYDSEDPFLIERDLGQGKVLVYTSTFSTTWTDFPVNEMYVPFVYQLIRYLERGDAARRQYTVGEVVALGGQPGDVWEVRTPDDRLVRATVDDQGTAFFHETDAPGHYTAQRGSEQFAFAVNVDPREAELDFRDAEEAYAAVVPPSDELPSDPAEAATADLADEEERQRFWFLLLLAAIALFAFETVWANRKQPARS